MATERFDKEAADWDSNRFTVNSSKRALGALLLEVSELKKYRDGVLFETPELKAQRLAGNDSGMFLLSRFYMLLPGHPGAASVCLYSNVPTLRFQNSWLSLAKLDVFNIPISARPVHSQGYYECFHPKRISVRSSHHCTMRCIYFTFNISISCSSTSCMLQRHYCPSPCPIAPMKHKHALLLPSSHLSPRTTHARQV